MPKRKTSFLDDCLPAGVSPNLVSAFIAVKTAGGELPRQRAIDDINETLDRRYTNSRLNEWEQGIRDPDREAVNYMIGEVMPEALKKAGIYTRPRVDYLQELVAWLTLPDRLEH